MVSAHATSKLSAFSDLESLQSYGFRGEALNAICQMGNVEIASQTKSDSRGLK